MHFPGDLYYTPDAQNAHNESSALLSQALVRPLCNLP